jgi:F-type H+-transporting ATPase subunit delta
MNESIIAVRYTKAIFALAKEKNILDAVMADMNIVYELLNQSLEMRRFFENPVIRPLKKQEITHQVFSSFHPVSQLFIDLLIKNKREEYLHQIALNFLNKYRKHSGIETAVFTSAIAVNDKTLESVIQLVKNIFKTDVELTSQVDEKIMGGFVLRVGDKQFDASVQSKLEKIKRKLINTTIN